MSDYIKREDAIDVIIVFYEKLKELEEKNEIMQGGKAIRCAVGYLQIIPSADVVPLSEHEAVVDGLCNKINEMAEVVWCKDCKWHTSDDECTHPYWDCEERIDYPTAMWFDYCSHGEREDMRGSDND